jgi:hypothetical protein
MFLFIKNSAGNKNQLRSTIGGRNLLPSISSNSGSVLIIHGNTRTIMAYKTLAIFPGLKSLVIKQASQNPRLPTTHG